MSAVAVETTIALEQSECTHSFCFEHASRLHAQLNTPKYTDGVSVMRVPVSRAAWEAEHRTARKRAWRCERLGYRFAPVDYAVHADDIHAINTSLERRQGRPMADGYTQRRAHGSLSVDQVRCPRHRTHTYGVLNGRTLVAYLTLHRAGELAMVSMILGHGDHLANDVMYLLFVGVVVDQCEQGGWFYYNRHDSGTDGLRFFKERVGFRPADIGWSL